MRLLTMFFALSMPLLSGCAAVRSSYVEVNGCPRGADAAVAETLFFGTFVGGQERVSESDWRGFVDEVVTPRFPDGLTWWRANGQWRGASGVIEREGSYVLRVVHPLSASHIAAVEEIREMYRQRFDQEAVMVERVRTCVDF